MDFGALLNEWSVNSPGSFGLISSHKKCLIASHNVEQQSFIGLRKLAESLRISEMQSLSLKPDCLSRRLDLEMEIETFLRLQSDNQLVGSDSVAFIGMEELDGRTAKTD
jgi:hypothetical protein